MKIKLHTFSLPLAHTFQIANHSRDHQLTLIVECIRDDKSGFGEVTASEYYQSPLPQMITILSDLRTELSQIPWTFPTKMWKAIKEILGKHPLCQQAPTSLAFPLSALDQAIWDLWGKEEQQPLFEVISPQSQKIPPSCFTLGHDKIPVMEQKLAQAKDWPSFKIKLGVDNDSQVLQALRAKTSKPFRVDVNCGWNLEEGKNILPLLAKMNIELLEQPFPATAYKETGNLQQRTSIPLIADESCRNEDDIAKCQGHFQGINIKLPKCGGITPAQKMIKIGRELGLKIMLGCMTESTIGISSIAQIAPLVDFLDMDGAALLAQDIAKGVQVINGEAKLIPAFGMGTELLFNSCHLKTY